MLKRISIGIIIFALIGIAVLCLTGCATWSKTDLALEAGFLTLHGIDWAQTNKIASNPDKWHENNPILGKHPSHGDVNALMGATMVLQPLIAHLLPHPYRRAWIIGTTVVKVGCVANNLGVGIGWGF
jgi:hypothetical protein